MEDSQMKPTGPAGKHADGQGSATSAPTSGACNASFASGSVGGSEGCPASGAAATADSYSARIRLSQAGIVAALLVLLAVLGAATYAWFTSNAKVNTNSVAVDSDSCELVVVLGDASSGTWSSSGEVAFSTNSPSDLTLYPVSTFDLSGFAECPYTSADGSAVHFEQAEDGQHFYHGWVDMRASVSGSGASKATGTVALYLADTLAPSGASVDLLKAARVGLKLSKNGQVVKTAYFPLDTTPGSHTSEHPATSPQLPGYQDGMLLGWANGSLACANDAAEDYTSYLMGSGESATRPAKVLANLEQGETYRLDVYYYIEGTDADSANYLYGDTGILHMQLFAVLDGQEG